MKIPAQRPQVSNQAGMVSIMVTMVMMLVISLIVLGFAQVSRREQRQSLDRQLSTQAFFAAESGINDARKVIEANIAAGVDIPDKTSCKTDNTTTPYTFDSQIGSDVSYSCLLVSNKIKSLKLTVPASGDSASVPLEPSGGTITKMHIEWTTNNATNPTYTSCKSTVTGSSTGKNTFPKDSAGWKCPYGLLRLDIVPTDDLSRSAMAANQKTIFFYPTTGAATTINYASTDGAVKVMNCDVTKCFIDVTGMGSFTNYALRFSSVYAAGNVDVSAVDSVGAPLDLKNGQVIVDSTGKAQDVLRRVQVRIPIAPSRSPFYAIESGSSICKRFSISKDYFKIPTDFTKQDTNNPMCVPVAVRPPCVATPHDIAMVLDTSNSMKAPWTTISRINELKIVSNRFIREVGIGDIPPNVNHGAVIQFNNNLGDSKVLQPLTSDSNAMLDAINSKLYLKYETRMSIGMNLAKAQFDDASLARPGVEKVILLISDGAPLPDPPEIPATLAAVKLLKDDGVIIYSILINPDNETAAADFMRSVATDPNHFVDAINESDLEAAISSISSSLGCP